MADNITLMQMARASLRGKWPLAIGTFAVYIIVTGSFGALHEAGLLALLVAGPMALGAAIFSLAVLRGKDARLEQVFDGFRDFSRSLVTHLLLLIYFILWSLLLIIPGIIAALSYSMSFYILADDKTLKPQQVLDRSKQMMYGYKAQLFWLCMRFFLLAVLCLFTLGIGFLWLIPYVNITMAAFYEDVKATGTKPGIPFTTANRN